MSAFHRVGLIALRMHSASVRLTIDTYKLFGLYRRFYESVGMSPAQARILEDHHQKTMKQGLFDMDAITRRFIVGKIGLCQFADEFTTWYASYVEKCWTLPEEKP